MIYKLTGKFLTDYTDASGTNCLDLNELKWSERILEAAEIGEEKLPDLYPSTHVAGEVTGSVAAECGLALLSLITPEHRHAVLLRKRDCALSSSTQTLQPS